MLTAALVLGAGLLLGRYMIARPSMTAQAAGAGAENSSPSLIYTAAVRYDALAWMRGGERFPQGAALMLDEGAGTVSSGHLPARGAKDLVKDFAASADANVSPDGKRVLFAGKKTAGDAWQVWELRLETGETEQVTRCHEDCVRPMYLEAGRVVYARRIAGNFVLEALRRVDGQVVRLTHFAGSALPTDVLRDGRVLFEAGFPLGSAVAAPEIYTVYSDGSGVEAYRCDHHAGVGRYEGRQTASGDVMFTKGRGLARFTSALAHEVAVDAPAGEYAGGAAQLPSGEWVSAWRAGATQRYALARWTAGAKTLTPLHAAAERNEVEPVLVTTRATPLRHPTALHEWSYANLLALDVYTSREAMPAGKVAAVRVRTLGEDGKVVTLGDAPVAKDGSFFVQVPGDAPVQFELRTAAGTVVRRERGWMWARAGEQRICVGCHAGPERAPDNAVPAILDRSVEPADLSHTHAQMLTAVRSAQPAAHAAHKQVETRATAGGR